MRNDPLKEQIDGQTNKDQALVGTGLLFNSLGRDMAINPR